MRLSLLSLLCAVPAFAQDNPFTKPGPAPVIPPKPTPAQAAEAFFTPAAKLSVYQVTVDDDMLKALNKEPKKYVRGQLRVEGKGYKDIAFHIKGSVGSFRNWNDKPALTINIDKFTHDQKFNGLDKFHLNNSVQDGSYMNELTCSLMAESLGLPTARVTHAIVELNGRKVGLYVFKEGYNSTFLRTNFPTNPGGNLYDGGFLQDLNSKLKLDHGTDVKGADLEQIVKACENKGTPKQRFDDVARLVDVELFCKDAALQLFFGDWDGYMRNHNNYRVYIPVGGQAVFIPHGMDQELQNPGEPFWHGYNSIVGRAVLDTPDGKKLTLDALKEIKEKHLTPEFYKKLDDFRERTLKALTDYDKGMAKQFDSESKAQRDRLKQRVGNLEKELPKMIAAFEKEQKKQ